MVPLDSVKNRFCPEHKVQLILSLLVGNIINFATTWKAQDAICSVIDCNNPTESDGMHKSNTCSLPEHRKLEVNNDLRNKAMFQLKHRLARLRVSQPVAAITPTTIGSSELADAAGSTLHTDEEVIVDADGVCDGKPEYGNKLIRARFGRRRTHNEQLCVASCGIILGRATFYGSEAPNGVRVSGGCVYAI